MRRVIPALAVPLAGAAVVHALPALTARGPARRLTPVSRAPAGPAEWP